MNLPNQAMVAAFGRHVVSYAMGALTFAAMTNVITSDQANVLTAAVSQIAHGVGDVAAGLAPIVSIVVGIYASRTASPASQLIAVANNPGVSRVVMNDPAAAGAVPNAKVVAP